MNKPDNSILRNDGHIDYFNYLDVKKLSPEAVLPTKNHDTDGGFDLYSLGNYRVEAQTSALISTGVAIEIPEGHVGLIQGRSGLAVKSGIDVLGGVIDNGYSGDVGVCLYNTKRPSVLAQLLYFFFKFKLAGGPESLSIKKGDRIAQIVILPIPKLKVRQVAELAPSVRGTAGFGSSGK